MNTVYVFALSFVFKSILVFLFLLAWHFVKVAIHKWCPDGRFKEVMLTNTRAWAQSELAKQRAERSERKARARDSLRVR